MNKACASFMTGPRSEVRKSVNLSSCKRNEVKAFIREKLHLLFLWPPQVRVCTDAQMRCGAAERSEP